MYTWVKSCQVVVICSIIINSSKDEQLIVVANYFHHTKKKLIGTFEYFLFDETITRGMIQSTNWAV